MPPKALFKKPRPPLIRVHACRDCHAPTAKDDEYAAGLMALRQEALGDDARHRRFTFLRSLERPESVRFRRSFMEGVRGVDLITPSGVVAGKGHYFTADLGRLADVTARITRGLWRHHHGHPLPLEVDVYVFPEGWVEQLDEAAKARLAGVAVPLLGVEDRLIGDGSVFRYRFMSVPTIDEATAWFLDFYRSTRFLVVTRPRDLEPDSVGQSDVANADDVGSASPRERRRTIGQLVCRDVPRIVARDRRGAENGDGE